MKWNRIFRILIYLLLFLITLIVVIVSVFHDSLMIFEPTPYILVLGLVFSIIFVLHGFLRNYIDFHSIVKRDGEFTTKISISEMSTILYYSTVKTGLPIIAFGAVNLVLTIINLFIFKYVSWGNVIFSGTLFWLIYGKYQIRHEIIGSIYNGNSVKHIIKHNSIEIISYNLHYELNIKDLEFEFINSNWVIFKRKKFNDYIILTNI